MAFPAPGARRASRPRGSPSPMLTVGLGRSPGGFSARGPGAWPVCLLGEPPGSLRDGGIQGYQASA